MIMISHLFDVRKIPTKWGGPRCNTALSDSLILLPPRPADNPSASTKCVIVSQGARESRTTSSKSVFVTWSRNFFGLRSSKWLPSPKGVRREWSWVRPVEIKEGVDGFFSFFCVLCIFLGAYRVSSNLSTSLPPIIYMHIYYTFSYSVFAPFFSYNT
jgi:hypothetical protein